MGATLLGVGCLNVAAPVVQATQAHPAPPPRPTMTDAPLPPPAPSITPAEIPPVQLPKASRERMRACGQQWDDKKRTGEEGELVWRTFAMSCLKETSTSQ